MRCTPFPATVCCLYPPSQTLQCVFFYGNQGLRHAGNLRVRVFTDGGSERAVTVCRERGGFGGHMRKTQYITVGCGSCGEQPRGSFRSFWFRDGRKSWHRIKRAAGQWPLVTMVTDISAKTAMKALNGT